MGSFIGHAVPGTMFIIAGIWWLCHAVLDYAATLKYGRNQAQGLKPRSWRQAPSPRCKNIPVEPFLKIFGGLIGICGELSPIQFKLLDKNNDFQSPNKFAHSAMYSFFALSGLVDVFNFYKITHFSREVEYAMLAVAFGVEGILFAFHLHGRDMFDVRIHTLLYIVIFLTALVVFLEACLPKFQRECFMARVVLVLTQGSWFWEIAYTLYGPNRWFVEADKDLTERQLMLDTEIMTVSFMWHLLSWIALLFCGCLITGCLHERNKLPGCCLLYGKREKMSSRLNGKSFANELPSDEEEILLKGGSDENKNSERSLTDNIDEEAAF